MRSLCVSCTNGAVVIVIAISEVWALGPPVGRPAGRAGQYTRAEVTQAEGQEAFETGRHLELGIAGKKDYATAAKHYEIAAAAGHNAARIALARLHFAERSRERDLDGAMQLLFDAAADGDSDAAGLLGWCYEYNFLDTKGKVVVGPRRKVLASWLAILMREQDRCRRFMIEREWGMNGASRHLPLSSVAWYRRAAGNGNVCASLKLAFYYFETSPTSVDVVLTYLDEAYAAGNAQILFALDGFYRLYGAQIADRNDRVECCQFLGRALARAMAKGHDPDAERCLGLVYDGIFDVEDADKEAARYWFGRELASRLELARDEDVLNQYKVAEILSRGRHVNADLDAAAQWYQRAANGGHPLAQKELARCYREGRGVPVDPAKASTWSARAEEQRLVEPRPGVISKGEQTGKEKGRD